MQKSSFQQKLSLKVKYRIDVKKKKEENDSKSKEQREIISLAVAGKLLRTGAVHIQDLLPYMKSAYRS